MKSVAAVTPLVALLFVTSGCPSPQTQPPAEDAGVTSDAGTQLPTDAGTDAGVGTLTLSLLAGNAGGSGTLDGPRATARFTGPVAFARDSQGNVFVVDQASCVIRKIDSAGMVSTFAGAPNQCGYAEGAGSLAHFANPSGIAVDAADNLYVADASNFVIRKITPAGVVSVFAGTPGQSAVVDGLGVAARFMSPEGITIDGAGNLYVADENAHAIRKITPAGEVTTLTGDPSAPGHADGTLAEARFNFVIAIVSDAAGNLWVTEEGVFSLDQGSAPFLIRHISTTGTVSTLAGDPTSGSGSVDGTGLAARFDGLEGITRDETGNLYVVERANLQLRKISAAGEVTTLAGAPGDGAFSKDGTGTEARFATPRGVLALPNGELLVADFAGSTLRHVSAQLEVTTWAGTVQQVGSVDGTGADARFREASAAVPDGQGGFVVSDTQNHTLRKVSATGVVTTWLGVPGEPGDADGQGADVRFNLPRGLAKDKDGNIFVADSGNHLIRKITPDGTVSLYAGGPGLRGGGDFVDGPLLDARFFAPIGLAFDATGRLFVADAANHSIRMIAGGEVSTIAGTGLPGFWDATGAEARLQLPYSIAISTDGTLFVAELMNHAIRKVSYDGSAWTVSTFAGALPDEFEQPFTGDADGTGTGARFHSPQSITFDGEGNLLVADTVNHLIRKISPAGEVTTFAGQRGKAGLTEGELPASLFEPLSLLALPDGGLFGTFSGGVFVIDRR